MSQPIISVEHLSKKYTIGENLHGRGARTFRDIFDYKINKILHGGKKREKSDNVLWAIKNVSFEVQEGEVIGIIGRNGAGKSTLLKLLSRITEPTEGKITIYGRVGSLLEVGTGFSLELTGRENIYLNGAILGMQKAKIDRKFDEIVNFAEVEKFLDTPVKHYSSGMYVRLAFAIAAHLEPEVLIVDEVLAVGDAQFQKKCLGKMEDVAKEGRTVLFVSHNMSAVLTLCTKGMILADGKCVGFGNTEKMISDYLSSGNELRGEVQDYSDTPKEKKLKIRRLRMLNDNIEVRNEFDRRNKIFLEITFEVLIPGIGYNIAFELWHLQHGCVFSSAIMDSNVENNRERKWNVGTYVFLVEIPVAILRGGDYYVVVSSAIPTIELLDQMSSELSFRLLDTDSPIARSSEGRRGIIIPVLNWEPRKVKENIL